jgi:hypothetical protein
MLCTLRFATGIILGLGVAEALVRLVTAWELDYVSFTRPGPYCMDLVLNRMTTACPGRSMTMRVPDEERYVPSDLNELGMRGPFTTRPRGNPQAAKVLIVGGASQGFGFALSADETYPSVAARRCDDLEIHNYALLGTNNEVTWDAAERTLFDQLKPDYLVLAIYFRDGHPDVSARVAPYVENGKGFVLIDGFEFFFPRRAPAWLRHWRTGVRAYDHWARAELDLDRATGWPPRLTPLPAQGPEPRTIETHAALVRELSARAEARHVPMSVLLLPFNAETNDDAMKAMLPEVHFIDAKAALDAAHLPAPFFPDGHYRSETADFVGRMVGAAICDARTRQVVAETRR